VNALFVNQKVWFAPRMETYFGVEHIAHMFPMVFVTGMHAQIKGNVTIAATIAGHSSIMSFVKK